MNRKIIALITVVLALLSTSACTAYSQIPQAVSSSNQPERQISVTGTGQVYLSPDIAYVNVGVRTQSEDVKKTLNENNQKADAIYETLMEMDVEEKDIQTTSLNVYPQQQYGPDGEISSTLYVAENSVNIKIRDLDKLGEILDAVIQSGANTINNINFSVEDQEEALAAARKMAVDDAHQQAVELADAAGVQLGDVLSINTSTSSTTSPQYSAKRATGIALDEVASVPISAGQLVISLQANLIYDIE